MAVGRTGPGRGCGEELQGLKDAGVDSIVDPTVVAWPATFRGRSGSTSRWHITDDVLPALREHGVDEAQITAMLVHNPARYFTGGQE